MCYAVRNASLNSGRGKNETYTALHRWLSNLHHNPNWPLLGGAFRVDSTLWSEGVGYMNKTEMNEYPRFIVAKGLVMPRTKATDIDNICTSIARKNKIYWSHYTLESVHPEFLYRATFVTKNNRTITTLIATEKA